MSMFNKSALVFTDLDGTLLDHNNYSFDAAFPTIEVLKEHDIPLIINSSKTFAEIIELRDQLEINTPFIVENGAAIFFELDYFDVIPEGVIKYQNYYVLELSKPISYWDSVFEKIEFEIDSPLERFSKMDDQRVSELTGLSLSDASKAKNRLYSDPIYFEGESADLEFLVKFMQHMGHHVLIGGRFIHITTGYNKGAALLELLDIYKTNEGVDYTTVSLGDSNNDIAMLEQSDISIVICNENKKPLQIKKKENTYTSTLFGPAGWNEVLGPIIQDSFI